jgi:hypothetical protein
LHNKAQVLPASVVERCELRGGRCESSRPNHPRLLIRAIDPRRSLFASGSKTDPDKPQLSGQHRFVDLRTLVFALTDRSHSLESACTAFGDPFEKDDVEYGVINQRMLHYAREDVRHSALLYERRLDELRRHDGVDLRPDRLYSPAGVGAAYLKAMKEHSSIMLSAVACKGRRRQSTRPASK